MIQKTRQIKNLERFTDPQGSETALETSYSHERSSVFGGMELSQR